tara:strand:- start:970 stop:1638 length:669 start_codon:yes stop_codon:yes gene_type:complete
MIRFKNVSKTFHLKGNHKTIARNMTMNFPSGKAIALMGRNGTGKSSLLQMIAGAIQPDSGTIEIDGTVSWPVGFMGSFHRDMTGAQNTRFLARIYGVDTEELIDFVEDFSELRGHFYQPVHTYSSGMRSRLGFACSMGIHFDWYLVDEVTAVGDSAFKEKSTRILKDRMETSSAIFVSHSIGDIRRICDTAIVLEKGSARYYRDLEEGIERHERNMLMERPD